MGKITEDRKQLEQILNGVPKKTKISIDDSEPVERLTLNKEPMVVTSKEFCGMEVPLPIYNICMNIIENLKDQGRYTKGMDFMIFNASVQQYLYNDLITQKVWQVATIPTRSLTTASESYRRALQALGLTVVDKKKGLDASEDAANNPLSNFLDAMNKDDGEAKTKVLKKKTKKTKEE